MSVAILSFFLFGTIRGWAVQNSPQNVQIAEIANGIHVTSDAGVVEFEMIRSNILRVDVQPAGKRSGRTLVMDPNLKSAVLAVVSTGQAGEQFSLRSAQIRVTVTHLSPLAFSICDAAGKELIEQSDPIEGASRHDATFHRLSSENLYGMSGLSMRENGGGLLRNNGSKVAAGAQGEAGAPWFFTTRYGVLIDSDGGTFDTRDGVIEFSGDSRDDLEYFVVVGKPMDVISGLATLTGHPPMPPRWTLGFLNSQWGSDEAEVKQIVANYRMKHIPIDGFILDFDWKAWGEDNYGEWRWNSTTSPESTYPNKFPDGASGAFATELRSEGIKLAGILKPRILVDSPGNSAPMHEAASYADQHGLWYADEPRIADYFSGRPTRDLDFSKPEARTWYWKHLEPTFKAGMVGWWGDEADAFDAGNNRTFYFDNFEFLNMGRALYDGQRGSSNVRVWSINRNYYLGAQRYGYAEWSGDIQTGFQSMQHQRMRMLATINVGEPHWSMDTGGFFGHPTPENYARWMEFAAFVPIDRVHGDYKEKRQPWVYGPLAEAAATNAIRLRYELMPYIYSYERIATETGVGVVRPLFWMFPDDPKLSNDCSSWMFGDGLLVSPVVEPGESVHEIYLPRGTWYDYFHGTRIEGGQTTLYKVNPETWEDIPLFVRSGSILASQQSQDFVDQSPISEVTLDVFPAAQLSQFVYYIDDGQTYSYERGDYYRQSISVSSTNGSVHLIFDQPSGTFKPALRSYIVRVHGIESRAVVVNDSALNKAGSAIPEDGSWIVGKDRFGSFTAIRIPANHLSSVVLR
jgi:alpha-glucosidase (family GH31 glycosyl hydrolase)